MSAELATATQEIQEETPKLKASLAFVQSYEIKSPEDYDFAGALVKDAKTAWKRLDGRRTEITKPLLQAKRSVDSLFKGALDMLSQIETLLKQKIGDYAAAKEREREAAMQAVSARLAAGETPTDIIPEPAHVKGVSVRSKWAFEIMDPDAVPRDLCSPDDKKIEAAIMYADTERTPPQPIPGVRFFLRQSVTVRT